MNILHVITTINRGGAENHLVELSIAQASKGHNVYIAYLHGDNYWRSYLESHKINCFPLKLIRYGDPIPLIRLRSVIKKLRPDIIHAHMPPAELYTRAALIGLLKENFRLIISKHIDAPFCKRPLNRLLSRWSANPAHKIICISKATKNYFQNSKELNLPSDKYKVIHYGINPKPYRCVNKELIEKLKKDFNIKDNQMVIGCVARLTEQKSIPTLIKALQILKKNKLNFKLLLIGRGELEAEIRALVAQLNLQDEVVLTGFREDIPALMNLFDIFALPSLYEGLGLVFLEAMAAGKPVITCNVSAMPEIISENNTGYLIPTKNTKELANKIELLSCPEHRQRFSNSCQNWIDKNFTVDKMLRETLNTYIS